MWWIFVHLFRFVLKLILEFTLFCMIDVVTKSVLRDAVSESEKKTIWLYESLLLFIICFFIYLLDHFPYLLFGLSTATCVYTQIRGRVDLQKVWTSIRTRWEEYQQHEESIRQMQARQQASAQQISNAGISMTHLSGHGQQVITPGQIPNYLHTMQSRSFISNIPGQNVSGMPVGNSQGLYLRPAPGNNMLLSVQSHLNNTNNYPTLLRTSSPFGVSYGCDSNASSSHATKYHEPVSDKSAGDPVAVKWFGGDLRRKPLRQVDSYFSISPSVVLASSSATALKIKNKVMNAIGLGAVCKSPLMHGVAAKLPPGLRNKGQNMCFINAVLQCLARSPYLAQYLAVDAAKELECMASETNLLSSLSELLDLLTAEPDTLGSNVLDPTAFRQATSALNKNLVAPVGQPQSQQDAAEFLMWLLDTVHGILNKNRQALSCGAESGKDERFSSPGLNMLRFIYGDLSLLKAKELKEACIREIELANGLENESYAEAIQRLSDVEWLLHKEMNESIVDALFTGQLVQASLSLPNRKISVTLQSFNVLPVPLAAPRVMSGPVLLEDCFTSFCHIENLIDPTSGVVGSTWNKVPLLKPMGNSGIGGDGMTTPQVKMQGSFNSCQSDSAFQSPVNRISSAVSPIVGHPEFVNDSGFDDAFRTSTPIRDSGVKIGIAGQSVDVKRRCLLRQLPECLIIQLMRFNYSVQLGRSTKIRAPVSVRLKGLDLHALVYDTVTQREDLTASAGSANQIYDLYGLCLHLGADSTHCGHYVSYSLASNGRWYRFDDEAVVEVNMDYELTTKEVRQNAYILFYKRAVN